MLGWQTKVSYSHSNELLIRSIYLISHRTCSILIERTRSSWNTTIGNMETEQERKTLVDEILRRIASLLSSSEYTIEEKERIARRFFQALESKED